MAFSGEDSDIRMSGNLGYTPLENLDNHSLIIQQQDKTISAPQNSHQSAERFSESQCGAPPNPSRSNKQPIILKAPSPSPSAVIVGGSSRNIYRECLKNHAASIGGNVTDGCGEFMPSGEDGTIEALKCAACSCHRNFHRRETQQENNNNNALVLHHHHLQLPPSLTSLSLNHRKSTTPPENHQWAVKMASGSVATDSSSEELNFNAYQSVGAAPYVVSKKRYRTKFSQEQKEKMLEFAEKLGWRIPREDDTQVQTFCAEVGVKRQVFKVWMHNNKTSSSSKTKNNNNNNDNPQQPLNIITTTTT